MYAKSLIVTLLIALPAAVPAAADPPDESTLKQTYDAFVESLDHRSLAKDYHDPRQHFLRVLSEDPESVGWTAWYILLPDDAGRKTLIGSVGACGLPDDSGTIVIGYSLLDRFHGKGHATEALRGFLEWVELHPRLRTVVADTFPHLTASIRVLENNGFVRCGAGADEGLIRFELVVHHSD